MKHFALILLFFSLKANCQREFKFDTNSFLLGMFDDYNGRLIALEKEESASYIATVKPEINKMFLDSISKTFNITKKEIIIKENSFFNRKIADEINKFFIAEINPDVDDYDEKNDISYKIYSLSLNEKKIKSAGQKLSFLTGMFYNCGSIINDEVVFQTANSSNFYIAIRFISELGFAYCEDAKPEYNIPTVQKVTFKPTKEYLNYLKKLTIEKKNGW